MGGLTIVGILERGLHNIKPGYELVLSPQSEIPEVRAFLRTHGIKIIDEEMIIEDDKYYNIIIVIELFVIPAFKWYKGCMVSIALS